jgi:flavorubredoxin
MLYPSAFSVVSKCEEIGWIICGHGDVFTILEGAREYRVWIEKTTT